MVIEFIENNSALIIIGATIFNIFVVYRNFKITEKKENEKVPVIDIKLDNFPPYIDENEKTILKLKNVGAKATDSDLNVLLSCSWIPSLSMKFNLPTETYFLAPNEEIVWKFRLDEKFPASSTIYVKITDKKDFNKFLFLKRSRIWYWELTEQL